MESILRQLDADTADGDHDSDDATLFLSFAEALRHFVQDGRGPSPPLRDGGAGKQQDGDDVDAGKDEDTFETAHWLYETCARVSTPLPPMQFASSVLSAIKSSGGDEGMMQGTLFELFGEGESNIELLFEVMGRAAEIGRVSEDELALAGGGDAPQDAAASGGGGAAGERILRLRAEAYEAAELAAALRADGPGSGRYASRGTHSVTRASDREAEKNSKKATKRALTAFHEARKEGALTESDEVFLGAQLGVKDGGGSAAERRLRDEEAMLYGMSRGLDGMDAHQIQGMRSNLAAEGTREYNDMNSRGLPKGTEREVCSGYEKVVIPAPVRDKSLLRSRIDLDEAMGADSDERAAFEGTKSLNPMQSAVFESAFTTRENLLVCAPTGEYCLIFPGAKFVHHGSLLSVLSLCNELLTYIVNNTVITRPTRKQARVRPTSPC